MVNEPHDSATVSQTLPEAEKNIRTQKHEASSSTSRSLGWGSREFHYEFNKFDDDTKKIYNENVTSSTPVGVPDLSEKNDLQTKEIHSGAHNDEVWPQVELCGELFNIEKTDDDFFIVYHPKWSISGMGETLSKAELNLYKEVNIAAEVYLKESVSKMNYEANKMRDFILKTVSFNAES
jgi:hypothetical protein